MIPRAFRILYPSPEIAGAELDPSAASTTAGAVSPSAPAVTTEHARLTEGTADLWRQLAAMVTP